MKSQFLKIALEIDRSVLLIWYIYKTNTILCVFVCSSLLQCGPNMCSGHQNQSFVSCNRNLLHVNRNSLFEANWFANEGSATHDYKASLNFHDLLY